MTTILKRGSEDLDGSRPKEIFGPMKASAGNTIDEKRHLARLKESSTPRTQPTNVLNTDERKLSLANYTDYH